MRRVVTAPDGTAASSDHLKTAALYLTIDEVADCGCDTCVNFRAAWNAQMLDADLLAACQILGIHPRKSLEMSVVDGESPLSLVYHGTFPFIGTLFPAVVPSEQFFRWGFTSVINGTARIAESNLIAIDFVVSVPRVLPKDTS